MGDWSNGVLGEGELGWWRKGGLGFWSDGVLGDGVIGWQLSVVIREHSIAFYSMIFRGRPDIGHLGFPLGGNGSPLDPIPPILHYSIPPFPIPHFPIPTDNFVFRRWLGRPHPLSLWFATRGTRRSGRC